MVKATGWEEEGGAARENGAEMFGQVLHNIEVSNNLSLSPTQPNPSLTQLLKPRYIVDLVKYAFVAYNMS
jgi:hypothetical protein